VLSSSQKMGTHFSCNTEVVHFMNDISDLLKSTSRGEGKIFDV